MQNWTCLNTEYHLRLTGAVYDCSTEFLWFTALVPGWSKERRAGGADVNRVSPWFLAAHVQLPSCSVSTVSKCKLQSWLRLPSAGNCLTTTSVEFDSSSDCHVHLHSSTSEAVVQRRVSGPPGGIWMSWDSSTKFIGTAIQQKTSEVLIDPKCFSFITWFYHSIWVKCMYVCTYVCVYVCMYVCMCVCVCVYVCVCMCVCVCVCVCMYVCVCVCVYVLCTYVHTYVRK